MAGIDIVPKDSDRFNTKRSKVSLFYINPDYDKAHNGSPPPQMVKGMAYTMPDLGEHIIIDEVFASDLLSKSGYKGKPVFMLESEGGAEVAALIKESMAQGEDWDPASMERIIIRQKMASMSDDELAQLMEDRGFTVAKAKMPDKKSDGKGTGTGKTKTPAKEKEDK